MPRKKTQHEAILDFRNQHGDKYDYSLVEYVNSTTKITVICSKHGNFQITPGHHKNGVGCRKCYDDSQKTSKDEFIRRSQEHWGDLYDYSFFDELPSAGKMVKIKCTLHNILFKQKPSNHIKGHTGCVQCKVLKLSGNKNNLGRIKTQAELNEEFIDRAKKIHGDSYDYSEFMYKNSAKSGKIICSKHGDFFQSPSNHLRGTKCPHCVIESFTVGTFKEKCIEKGIDYHRALKRRQAGLNEEKIFSPDYIRHEREINKVTVFGEEYPNIEEATRVLRPPASSTTINRWIKEGMKLEEAFERIPNPGYADGIIYLITNNLNEKQYIGLTVQTLERRWRYHQEQANTNHIKSKESLHAAIREFGADNFSIKAIDSGTTKKGLERKEREWIKKLNTLIPNGYNISTGGISGGSNSKPTTIDGKRFKSVKEAAKYVSETRKILYEAAKGRIRSGRIDVKTPSKPGESYVKSKVYKTWSSIKHGSINPNSRDYIPNIEFHNRWNDFLLFREDVGEPTYMDMVFKRIDQDKGFFPSNCKWMTKSEACKINAQHMKTKGTLKGRKSKKK
ncbi:MAG: GIY-YIG nuclease family protein [Cytophagaceae bacterium]|nr:GIY-YIG nuclease family protein [Cytophagaceae bacterium]MBL0326091.1 GIY-YIG nuclease family protein [Cytophagaceae bacterium]